MRFITISPPKVPLGGLFVGLLQLLLTLPNYTSCVELFLTCLSAGAFISRGMAELAEFTAEAAFTVNYS